jgi:hypothetical protein
LNLFFIFRILNGVLFIGGFIYMCYFKCTVR